MAKQLREAYLVTGAVLLAVALIALIAACSGSSGGSGDAVSEEAAGPDKAVAEHSDGGVVQSDGDEMVVAIRTERVKFVPDTVTVKVGQTVRLRLDNHDPVVHDYTVDEPDFMVMEANGAEHGDHEVVAAQGEDEDAVASHDDEHGGEGMEMVSLAPLHIAAEGDEHAELVFEATEPGEYVFYCSVPGHREAGMEGTIIVEA